jgi:hypothetical protein
MLATGPARTRPGARGSPRALSATLVAMLATRQRRYRRTARRRPRAHAVRRLAGLGILAVLVVVLAVVVFSSGEDGGPTAGIAAVPAAALAPDGPPRPQQLAGAGPIDDLLEVPVTQARITAIVYHGIGDDAVIPLEPVGDQQNQSFLSRLSERVFGGESSGGPDYYVDGSGDGADTGSVDIGAHAGTTVYAPADGIVVSIRDHIINGTAYGNVVQIRPDVAPALTITLTNVKKADGLVVGTRVSASRTALGTVVDLSKVMEQTVAHYTSDEGNHVAITIERSQGASPLL